MHPILVHYPITSFVLAYTCDLAIPLVRSSLLPVTLARFVPPITTLSAISFYANAAGVLFALPATITGTHEMWEIYSRQGTSEQRVIKQGVVAQDYNEKAKNVGLLHGALNYGLCESAAPGRLRRQADQCPSAGVAIYNWIARRKQPSMIPTTFQSGLSAVALVTLIWSAYLGGELVYK